MIRIFSYQDLCEDDVMLLDTYDDVRAFHIVLFVLACNI